MIKVKLYSWKKKLYLYVFSFALHVNNGEKKYCSPKINKFNLRLLDFANQREIQLFGWILCNIALLADCPPCSIITLHKVSSQETEKLCKQASSRRLYGRYLTHSSRQPTKCPQGPKFRSARESTSIKMPACVQLSLFCFYCPVGSILVFVLGLLDGSSVNQYLNIISLRQG